MSLNFDYFKNIIKILIDGTKELYNDLFNEHKIVKNIPNLLTISRLIISVITCFAIMHGITIKIIILYGIGGLTDMFDGLIARKLKITSKYGECLDAIIDKFFVTLPIIILGLNNPYLALLVINEAIIGSINIIALLKGKNPKSNKIGKLKTWFLFSAILSGVGLSSVNVTNYINNLDLIFKYIFASSFVLQIASIIKYTVDYNNEMPPLNIEEFQKVSESKDDKSSEITKSKCKQQIDELNNYKKYLEFNPDQNIIKIKKRNDL